MQLETSLYCFSKSENVQISKLAGRSDRVRFDYSLVGCASSVDSGREASACIHNKYINKIAS